VPEPLSLRLKEIKDLPTIPAMAAAALQVADDPASTASDLLRVILTDPPIAARVLRVANSAFFRPTVRGEVTELQTAIVRLGFTNVRNLLMGVSVIRSFNAFFVDSPYTREDFWVHCISVGALAGRLCQGNPRISSSTAFVTGLLHDLGKLVLDRYERAAFTRALRLSQGERLPLDVAERREFGSDHSAIAGDLMDLWNFPKELSDPVRFHHDPERCPEPHRFGAVILQVADYVCNVNGLGYSGNTHPAPLPEGSWELVGTRPEDLKTHLESLRNEPLVAALMPA
jgi:HD-like signal output (HDOD) protein